MDATTEGGRDVLLDLVRQCDCLAINRTARVLDDFGLTYDVLRAANPSVVLLNMPAVGTMGPHRSLIGYGILMEALGGFASRFGARDEGAMTSNTYYPDAVAGIHATCALLSGLALRERSPVREGVSIDLSQQEQVWMCLGEGITKQTLSYADSHSSWPQPIGRMGAAEPGCAPSGYFACAPNAGTVVDTSVGTGTGTNGHSHLALHIGDDAQWRALLDHLSRMPASSSFASASASAAVAEFLRVFGSELYSHQAVRVRHRDAIEVALQAQVLTLQPAKAWAASLSGLGLAVEEVLRSVSGPAVQTAGFWQPTLSHPLTGALSYGRIALQVDGQPVDHHSHAPLYDHHTDAVLSDVLGYSPAKIAALRADGAVGTAPKGWRRAFRAAAGGASRRARASRL